MKQKQSVVFGAWVNGTWTEIKAKYKLNAFRYFRLLNETIKFHQVHKTESINSHSASIENEEKQNSNNNIYRDSIV